jgi:NitT/TauT family transport system substrate-binding protein
LQRRAFLTFSLGALASVGCTPASGVTGTLRLGYLANLTHAPALVGAAKLTLPGVEVKTRTFRAGPRVCEALLGNAIDVGVSGPGPIVSMHARHGGNPLALVSGMTSGGASLVVLPAVRGPGDLAGRRVATPQLGSTPDVSLRAWLSKQGLVTKERGGDVVVDALASADILAQMRRGQIAGAWLPEPWASRIVFELGARRMIDERDLWPARRFPTALVVVRRPFYEARRAEVDAVVRAFHEQIARATRDASMKTAAFAEIKRLTGKGLPKPVMDAAWERLEFTVDPMPSALATMAEDARALGYVPSADVRGLLA